MDLITAEHVRALSTAPEGSALVISKGRALVLPGPFSEVNGYLVIGREDLSGLLGNVRDDHAVEELAQRLNSAVVELGG
ncbi:hypothetical protein [Sporichthya polymorpha]|uniref:hypothetical protein n=1 Tax=Sporichthya polymorpha TaxID=35751 RepID=UPI00039BDD63|nr:hypothetical protein [Sporichthya polymorpha]